MWNVYDLIILTVIVFQYRSILLPQSVDFEINYLISFSSTLWNFVVNFIVFVERFSDFCSRLSRIDFEFSFLAVDFISWFDVLFLIWSVLAVSAVIVGLVRIRLLFIFQLLDLFVLFVWSCSFLHSGPCILTFYNFLVLPGIHVWVSDFVLSKKRHGFVELFFCPLYFSFFIFSYYTFLFDFVARDTFSSIRLSCVSCLSLTLTSFTVIFFSSSILSPSFMSVVEVIFFESNNSVGLISENQNFFPVCIVFPSVNQMFRFVSASPKSCKCRGFCKFSPSV